MNAFESRFTVAGNITFPSFTGVRVILLPIRLDDPDTIPDIVGGWRSAITDLCKMAGAPSDVGYVTIDEACVKAGVTHRRPGLHVDGIGPDGGPVIWGGSPPAPYAGQSGMYIAASHIGCRGFAQTFTGWPGPDGDCTHLVDQCGEATLFEPGVVYHCERMTVHESIPADDDQRRQFIRLSMPSDCPWYEGSTANPLGVKPTGPIHPKRVAYMAYGDRHMGKV